LNPDILVELLGSHLTVASGSRSNHSSRLINI